MGVAALGAGMQVGGQIGEGYGQDQALRSMESAWQDQAAHQADADARLRALTEQLMGQVGIDKNMNAGGEAALQQQLDAVTRNTTAGAKAEFARRGKMGAEEHARASRAYDAAGANGRRLAQYLATLQAYRQGSQQTDQAGQQFAVNRGFVLNDANAWRRLSPLQQRAAGMHGAIARGMGQNLQALGQGTMQYGMSQQANGDPGTMESNIYSPGATDMRGSIYTDPNTGMQTAQS
jgi:hypothetical protein